MSRTGCLSLTFAFAAGWLFAQEPDAMRWDSRMATEKAVVDTNGVKWVDGKYLPIEGRWTLGDTPTYYERLPNTLTTNVNPGVRGMRLNTSGMQFRFKTSSRNLILAWKNSGRAMPHMPATGVSGIDVYRFDAGKGCWRYVSTGRPDKADAEGYFTLRLNGMAANLSYLVNLPLYNGIEAFRLGIEKDAEVSALAPRASGVTKPVVFYGTSITHGGCASRPGLGFVNIVGRALDVPVFGLGFSGCGLMEYELSDVISRIDASCYVLDCLWNMSEKDDAMKGSICRGVGRNYEPFIRNLRAKRPGVPIVMAEQCDVYMNGSNQKDIFIRKLYEKLIAEGWKDLYYLPKDEMHTGDFEGTVDGCHPNDWGMMSMAKAYGKAVRQALKLKD